ncbi:MAG: hypothetical protein ACWA42_03150 [Lutibacter sp.]
MKELELLKKDWKKQGEKLNELSYQEIYTIIHKKSSSIVKWIFFISIAEFAFWTVLNFFIPDSIFEIYEKFNLKSSLINASVIYYIIVVFFIYKFYKNYKSISVEDNTKNLMQKIITTRKVVNYYVYFALIFNFLLSVIFTIIMFNNSSVMLEVINPKHIAINEDKMLLITLLVQIGVIIVMIGLLWVYYRILYGILLKRLSKNYKELKKMEF